jgi:hypothetical protein
MAAGDRMTISTPHPAAFINHTTEVRGAHACVRRAQKRRWQVFERSTQVRSESAGQQPLTEKRALEQHHELSGRGNLWTYSLR